MPPRWYFGSEDKVGRAQRFLWWALRGYILLCAIWQHLYWFGG